MSPEKPLHVQVAEALERIDTWEVQEKGGKGKRWVLSPKAGGPGGSGVWAYVPLYDTDWAATGPLIEQYGFWLRQLDQTLSGPQPWHAFRNDDLTFPRGFGPTPLIAVCRLILALAEAGVLKAA